MKPSMKTTVRRTSVSAVVTIAIIITGLVSCLAARATEPRLGHGTSACCRPTWCDGCCQPICCCPDDYCSKPAPCVPCLPGPWYCDDYCCKPLPWLPCTPLGRYCDDYCEKPCPACPPRLCTDLNRFSAAGVSRYAQGAPAVPDSYGVQATPQPLLFSPTPQSAPSSLLPLPPLHVPAPAAEMPSPTGKIDSTVRMPTLQGPVR